jgi:proton-coupled amino acid transporter
MVGAEAYAQSHKYGQTALDSDKEDDSELPLGASPETKKRVLHDIEKQEVKKLNWMQTYVTLIKGFVCTGIIYLPTAFWNGGYIFSVVSLFMAYILTVICAVKLLKVSKVHPGLSFSELGGKIYGTKGRVAADCSIIASQVGFVTAYVAFIVDSLREVI